MKCFALPDVPAVVRLEEDGSFSQLLETGAWAPTEADLADLLTGDGGAYEIDVVDEQEPVALMTAALGEKVSPAQRQVVRDTMLGVIARWEAAIEDMLVAHFARQEAVVLSRLEGVKARKGTRHWRPAPPEMEAKALNAEQIVAPAQWSIEVERDAGELFHRLFEDQVGDITDSPFVRDAIEQHVRRLMSTTEARAQKVVDKILELDSTDAELAEIVEAVKGTYSQRQIWGAQTARTEVTASVNEASLARALSLGAATKGWLSSRDDRVRMTHSSIGGGDGQVVPIALPFVIGGFPLMYPGDPAGPPHEVMGCRCVLEFEGVDPYDPAATAPAAGSSAALDADAALMQQLAPSLAVNAIPGLAALTATWALVDAGRDIMPSLNAGVAAMARVSVAGAVLAARLPGLLRPKVEVAQAVLVLMALVKWHRAAVARGDVEEAAGYVDDVVATAERLGLEASELVQALDDERTAEGAQ